jgi:acyl carrier protein
MNVIEEEFGFEADLEAIADLNTFERVYNYVQKAAGSM